MNKKVLKTLEYHKILNMIASLADSEPGRERVLNLHPLSSKEKIKQLLKQTDDAVNRLFRKGKPDFTHVVDVTDMLKRLKAESSLNAAELLAIAELLICAEDAVKYYEDLFEDSLTAMYSSLDPITTLSRSIKKCIISEDHIASNASPTLAQIRKSQEETKDRITTELNRMLSSPSVRECLQDVIITSRQGRYCLPVKAEYKRRITGMIHDRSATGSTLFIEPSIVVNLNNELKQLEIDEKKEIEKILKKLSEETAEYTEVIFEDFRTLSILDFIYAKASWCKNNKCSMPEINLDNYVDLKTARHPLIPADKVVPIDIHIGNDFSTLVITGPNTGGKTVTLKTVGLLCLLAYSGLLIPSDVGSKVAVFKEIFADIGDEQSIEDDLSTYSSHLTNMKIMMKSCNERSLILIDEFGGGTEPQIGGAIAEAVLKRFNQKRTFGVITTHYQNLKHFAEDHEGVVNGAMLYDRHLMQALFQLQIGNPGSSFAVEIARKIGLPEDVIADASEIVGSEYINADKYLQDIVRDKRYWEGKRQTIRQREKHMEDTIARYQAEMEELQKSRKEIIRQAKEEAERMLQESNARIENTIRTIKEAQAEKEKTRMARQELTDFRTSLDALASKEQEEKMARKMEKLKEKQERKKNKKNEQKAASSSTTATPKVAPISVGENVKIKGQTSVGQVMEISGKNAIVAFGSIKTTVKLDRTLQRGPQDGKHGQKFLCQQPDT